MTDDRLAERLTAIFVEELEQQLRGMSGDLLELEANPADADRLRSVFRAAHTLKGAARAAGFPAIESACEAAETLLSQARSGALTLNAAHFSRLLATADALEDAADRLRHGRSLEDAPISALAGGDTPVRRTAPAAPAPSPSPSRGPDTRAGPSQPAPASSAATARVRVDMEQLDALLASAGELLSATRRVADRRRQMGDLQEEATRCVAAFRRMTRRANGGVDAAAARSVAELEQGLTRLLEQIRALAGKSQREARLLGRLAGDLDGTMRRLRMRPFSDACEQLPRVIRDVGASGGKQVRLEIGGGEVAADRAVLDAVREALLHLVRNAVDHGIEPPRVRRERDKPETGTVRVAAELRGDRLLVVVEDDGAGLDLGAIRAHRERTGHPTPETDAELTRLLFEGGVTTRMEATAISGRGVGLDAVRAAVERVRGRVDVSWEEGRGTRFTLDLPLSLAALRALFVGVGDQVIAFPTADVERLLSVGPDRLARIDGRDVVTGGDGPIPLVSLAEVLGPPFPPLLAREPLAVVQLSAGGRRLAVAVDELLSEQEVIVRPVHPLPRRPAHLAGLAILGEGRLAVVLEPRALIRAAMDAPAAAVAAAPAREAAAVKRTIVVADDSITTRALEESILQAAGYRVLTAADGAEAWRLVREHGCDLVVSDVEMPRMDGFQLCEAIRASKRFSELPVVLVTALESPQDRARGLEVGADAYIPKSSFDQQRLLDSIARLIG